jgi:hypothetical protein
MGYMDSWKFMDSTFLLGNYIDDGFMETMDSVPSKYVKMGQNMEKVGRWE